MIASKKKLIIIGISRNRYIICIGKMGFHVRKLIFCIKKECFFIHN